MNRVSLLCGFVCISLMVGACEFEDRPRTEVQEVRILSGRVEPAEVAFGEATLDNPIALTRAVHLDFEMLVVDPRNPGETLDVSVVACTEIQPDGICLETLQYTTLGEPWVNEDGALTEMAWRDYLTRHSWRGQVTLDGPSGIATGELDTFEGWPYYLQTLNLIEQDARLMVLACLPDACDVFEDFDRYLANPEAIGGVDLLPRLALMEAATSNLEPESYSFGRKNYRVSLREPEDANLNPRIESIFIGSTLASDGDVAELETSQSVTVRMTPDSFEEIYVDSGLIGIEALTVSLVSTSGVVAPNVLQVSYTVGEIQTSWEVPEPEEAWLWAIVRDSRGGMGWLEAAAAP